MSDKTTAMGTNLDPLLLSDLIGIQRIGDDIHYKSTLTTLQTLIGGGVAAGASSLDVTQANAFSVGDTISRTAVAWSLADADSAGLFLPCNAIVTAATAADFTAAVSGFQTWATHGLAGIGQAYYLSTTAGGVVLGRPGVPGQIIQRVLVPVDANTIIVTIGEAWT